MIKKIDRKQTRINIQSRNKIFTARLLDNRSSQALLTLLPLTISMIELNRNEKYYALLKDLPTQSQQVRTINNGDLMLYGSNTLVLFYESFNTPYSYTKLGYIEDVSELANTLGTGNIEVTFRLEK